MVVLGWVGGCTPLGQTEHSSGEPGRGRERGGGGGNEDVDLGGERSAGRGGVQEVFAEWVGAEYTVAGLTRRRTIFADHT